MRRGATTLTFISFVAQDPHNTKVVSEALFGHWFDQLCVEELRSYLCPPNLHILENHFAVFSIMYFSVYAYISICIGAHYRCLTGCTVSGMWLTGRIPAVYGGLKRACFDYFLPATTTPRSTPAGTFSGLLSFGLSSKYHLLMVSRLVGFPLPSSKQHKRFQDGVSFWFVTSQLCRVLWHVFGDCSRSDRFHWGGMFAFSVLQSFPQFTFLNVINL